MARSLELETAPARGGAVMLELLRAMRPRQWIKNTWVFAAIAFSAERLWIQPDKVLLVAGSVCALLHGRRRDLPDQRPGRHREGSRHPKKRNRPIASGRLRPGIAVAAAIVLMLIVLPGAYLLDNLERARPESRPAGGHAGLYADPGLAVHLLLKNIVIIDIFTIAAGFLLRAVAGAVVLDIPISSWLLICMGLLALFLGLGKRRAELVLLEEGATEHRRILDEYSVPMLDQMISIVTAATIIAYTLFTTTAPTLPHARYPVMMVTVPSWSMASSAISI